MLTAWVSHIQIHPIKSLDATTLQQAGILSSGALAFDRKWTMFDTNGKFVNGKRHAAVHRLRSGCTHAPQAPSPHLHSYISMSELS